MNYRLMKGMRGLWMLVIAAVMGAVVMTLWNWVMPALYFGINTIDYWHALGLLVLARILVGGFRGHGRHGWHGHHHWQKWQAMTEEERAQFGRGRADFFKRHDAARDENNA
jgi:hypothetical protein